MYCLLIEQAAQITSLHKTVNKLQTQLMHLQGTETFPATNAAQGDKGNSETTNLGTTTNSYKSIPTPASLEDQRI